MLTYKNCHMNYKTTIIRFAFILSAILFISFQLQAREVITLQTGWKFQKEILIMPLSPVSTIQNGKMYYPSRLGHFRSCNTRWGRKYRKIAMERRGLVQEKPGYSIYYKGKNVYLVFDGIMSNPEIFVNGKFAGKWDYGYNSFYLI